VKTDQSLFAPDCFHFSRRGHAVAASSLWSNMFQQVGRKDMEFHQDQDELTCPDSGCPYIRTWLNSANCTPAVINPLSTLIPAIENLTSDIWGDLTNTSGYPYGPGHYSTWGPGGGNGTALPPHWNATWPSFTWPQWTVTWPTWPDWNATWKTVIVNTTEIYVNVTLKPWHRAAIKLAQVSGWSRGVSAASGGWIAFGVVLALVVVATGILGYVDMKKRRHRRDVRDERTPLLNAGSNL